MSNNPETYGPKCGGVNPQDDAIKCQHQTNQQQVAMTKGGGNEVPPGKQIAPQAEGGVEVNSPQNNGSNSASINSASNQTSANSKYDNVTPGPVDNDSGPSGGSRKKRTRKYRKTKKHSKIRRRKSQKSRRRKVYVGCNGNSRKRLGGKTKKQSGWGCMSGGKRKNRKSKRRTKKCKRVRFRM